MGKWQLGRVDRGLFVLEDGEGVLLVLVDVVGPQPQVFAVRGAEVVRTVGALVLPHGRPEATVAHTALLLLALCDHRGLLGVRPLPATIAGY